MTATDPELLRLLLLEMERHQVTLDERPRDRTAILRAVHALKGSAGLAGERELSATLERLHRRIDEGVETAFEEAASLVRTATTRLAAGESAMAARWPVPPDDLAARPLDPLVRAQYSAEITDRLASIDEALSSFDPVDAVREIYRHVHTLKGAASAVGDEPMSWFCHGLEERLKNADSVGGAAYAAQEVARWRTVLGGFVEDPDAALVRLRLGSRTSQSPRESKGVRSSAPPFDSDPSRASAFDDTATTIRVAATDVDRLLERLDAIDVIREGLGARVESTRHTALAMRDMRSSLIEALRLIGPPRPWGAPAAALRRIEDVTSALTIFAEDLEAAGGRLKSTEHALRDDVTYAKRRLSTMRRTSVGRIFARLTTAIESEARRAGRAVIVRSRGAEEAIDPRAAEQLIEPCLQLVRNAVAHGIETPELRATLGKPPSGTISLEALRLGNHLSITIQDDGAGVDVADVRARALAAGLVTGPIAEVADDDTLLSLLFVPGFSTRESSDLLAGRGIGLDITRSVVQRMGGAIRLSSRKGQGFSARIDVPLESGLVMVLWVLAGDSEFAVPAFNVRRVLHLDHGAERSRDANHVPHLLACLDVGADEETRYILELELQDDESTAPSVTLGVDGIGPTEEVLVRPLGPLIAGLGPFGGAIVRGDGSLRLAIDAWAIAPRARAFSAAGTTSWSGRPPPSKA